MKNFILFFLFFSWFCPLESNAQLSGLRYGRLANGLTYYIMQEEDFAGEVNFFLYKNIGAILENDDQQGMAHFLEHLSFNTTEHFPHGVMNFLRDKNVVFNALTGINETSFRLYNIPVSKKELTDSLLLVVKDWCNGVLFPKESVEKERNIILEEWRQDRTVEKRLSESIAPVIFNKSRYGYRNVIGDQAALKKYSAKDLKCFYDKWYKPEFQFIVIVGDIDPDYWEMQVKKMFGTISPSKKMLVREKTFIEDNEQPLYYRFIDKENISNSFGIYQRRHVISDTSEKSAARESMMSQLFQKLVNRQLSMLRNEGVETYIAATMGYAPSVRFYEQNAWDVVPYEGKEIEALEQILRIREKIRRQGFSKREFEEVKWSIYNGIKSLLENEHLGTPDNLMNLFKQHYLYGQSLQSFRQQLTTSMEELVELEADDLHRWICSWMNDKNITFITYSARPEDMNISYDQFTSCLTKASELPLLDFKEPEEVKNLIDFNITPGHIVEEKEITDLKVEKWILTNGVNVLYKYLPSEDGRVYFVGSAKGGASIVETKDLASYFAMRSLLMQSGLYKYNRNQLHQWCQNNGIDLSLSITDDVIGIGGNASKYNIESLLQYVYLVIMHQNFDEQIFKKFVERKKYLYLTRNISGMSAVQDSINDLLYPPTEDNPKEDLAFYDKMRYEDLQKIYNNQFGNTGEFTFCLIGDISKKDAQNLVEKYIASLSGKKTSSPRKFYMRNKESESEEIVREFHADIEGDIGEVELSFINNKELSQKEILSLSLLKELIQFRMFEELREKEHGVYNVAVDVNYVSEPKPVSVFKVHFSTERQKVDEMKKCAYRIIEEISNNLFSDDLFKKVRIPFLLEENNNLDMAQSTADDISEINDPMLWLAILNSYAEQGDSWNISDAKIKTDFSIGNVTRMELAEIFKKILDGAKKRDIVVKSNPLTNSHWER